MGAFDTKSTATHSYAKAISVSARLAGIASTHRRA
jgi:hypothetical protein